MIRKILLGLIAFVFISSFVLGATQQPFSGSTSGTARFVTQPDFNKYYAGSRIQTYWPILGDKNTCDSRQDIILQISPGGCQPNVVRSDLLAEQNVPVFCQIDALTLNPLIDVRKIENIRFTGKYPAEIIGTGFHPARASLQTHDALLGSPLINNIGYVVVILKKNPNEKSLPALVNLTLSAQIDYDAQDALGIGRTEFLLPIVSDEAWKTEKLRQGFFQGRYFLRADSFDSNKATIEVYYGDDKVSSVNVKKGDTSRDVNTGGLYCQVSFEVSYDGIVSTGAVAQLKIDDEYLDVYEGSKFLNNKCTVNKIDSNNASSLGNVSIRCTSDGAGSGNINLRISGQTYEKGDSVKLRNGDKLSLEEWVVSDNLGGEKYKLQRLGENEEVLETKEFMTNMFVGVNPKLTEVTLEPNAQKAFSDAIEAYKDVAESYPAETLDNVTGNTYGQRALEQAVNLAENSNKQATELQVLDTLLNNYPNAPPEFSRKFNDLSSYDFGSSFTSVVISRQAHTIRLVEINSPKGRASAKFGWGQRTFSVSLGDSHEEPGIGKVVLEKLDAETAQVSVSCRDSGTGQISKDKLENVKPFSLVNSEGQTLCGAVLHLDDINIQRFAKVRLNSKANDLRSQTNLTVGIGIEKRAIQLSPNKTLEKIADLNKTIQKWESISKSLGNTVSGLKTACFATSGVLIAKNFLTGLSGEGIARQKAMNTYWTDYCKNHLTSVGGSYHTLGECYLDKSSDINRDVSKVKSILEAENVQIKGIEDKYKASAGGFGGIFGESSVDTNRSANDFRNVVLGEYGDEKVEGSSVKDLFNSTGYENGEFTYDQIRDFKMNMDLAKQGSPEMQEAARKRLKEISLTVKDNQEFTRKTAELNKDVSTGLPGYTQVFSTSGHTLITPVSTVESVKIKDINFDVNTKYVARVSAHATALNPQTGTSDFASGGYVLGLQQVGTAYQVKEAFYNNNGVYEKVDEKKFASTYGISDVKPADQVSYHNRIKDPKVQYYETSPYKGMPALVPFDSLNGWYAATEQNLPVFGGIGAFEANGRVVSFWLCNVGDNGVAQFFEGKGDDICQLVNLNTGQPLNQFPGLSQDEAKRLTDKAVTAIQDAARNYGSGKNAIRVGSETVQVGRPAANVPATQCQDFMSPEECLAMFNVCDPVICPASRCDLGGAYPVADVVQTGVVGSALLCLPNIREGVVIPVCLTGIKSGIDSYLSILKSERDCLQENVKSGQLVGICDEITSIYTCEFFWRQIGPVANVLLPKVVELATGKTSPRGGGEYLTVPAAWENAQNSVKYFTDTYAVNSLEAFKIRSVEEAGGTFCRAFISAKAPSALKSLVKPDSPPQFYAWFSSIRYSDATVPATAQYKVFYHIFSGEDQGVSYSVYLKEPPATSYYQTSPTVFVDSGFVPKGQYKSITKDFTAPEGYKQLCVRINDEEECGFGQVSTDFAVNYIADSYAQNELKRKDITSQSACISGTPNPLAVVNPNIQSGVENTILPNDPGRGIVRICGSSNPGSQTDPLRFVDVGYCGDTKIRCWLDKKSVNDALTESAVYAKNETLSSLEDTQIDALENAGIVLPEGQATAAIKDFEGEVKTFETSNNINVESYGKDLISRMDSLGSQIYLNNHKAHLSFLKARTLEQIFVKKYPATQTSNSVKEEVKVVIQETKEIINSISVVNGSLVSRSSEVPAIVGESLIIHVEHTCGINAFVSISKDGKVVQTGLLAGPNGSSIVPTNDFLIGGLGAAGNYVIEVKCVGKNNSPISGSTAKTFNLSVE